MAQTYIVEQGDTLMTIAEQFDFGSWEDLYEHASNKALKALRPNPHCLYPGDEVAIPDKLLNAVKCPVDDEYKFQLKVQPHFFRLVLKDEDELPCAGIRYELTVGEEVFEGRTFIDGHLQHNVPVNEREGELKVWYEEDQEEPDVFPVMIGYLDPIDTVSGAQARLRNLGFYYGEIDGDAGEQTLAALKAFCKSYELEVTEDISDSALLKVLGKAHDEIDEK